MGREKKNVLMGFPDYRGNPKLCVLLFSVSKKQRHGSGKQRAIGVLQPHPGLVPPGRVFVAPAARCVVAVSSTCALLLGTASRGLRLRLCLTERAAAAAQCHLEPSLGLLRAAGDVCPHLGDFSSPSSILVQTCLWWQLAAELGTELTQMQTQERHFPGGTWEVAKEGNASLRGCRQLCWSSSAGAQSQAALPHFWLLLLHFLFLNFPVTCFSCQFLVSLSSATIPLQPGCLPQGVPSLNHHRIWGHYGNCMLWQEAEFAVWSVTVVGFVQHERRLAFLLRHVAQD